MSDPHDPVSTADAFDDTSTPEGSTSAGSTPADAGRVTPEGMGPYDTASDGELRTALARHLLSRFRAIVREKGDAREMQYTAQAFDVARLFGAGVPSSSDFMQRYWTTLGPVIYAPPGRLADLGANVRVLAHEVGHVVDFWVNPPMFVVRYLTDFGRAELEAHAERGALEVVWLLEGRLPSYIGVDVTRHGYALGEGHADLTRDLLEQAATSVASGLVSTDVGIAAREWLLKNAPQRIRGTVVLP